ncbi:mitochondrial inner membrane protease ATP23 homolog isoform 3-T3 [Leptodactylus fuscus]|uniref:mitochondrial inner membrane protease ATP23 homolog isoform X2 n=1 Tax=Leptodactylus fuscus TaxID=238119 RepID=UPI003F4E9064
MEEDKPGKDEHGYHLFPQRDPKNPKKEPFLSKVYGLKLRCKARMKIAMETSPHVKLLLDAMSQAGCTAYRDRHFACEECDGQVGGGFDSSTSEIRAASLSGDCSLSNEMSRFKFGIKQHHQTCVRDRAVRSIMAARKFSQETAEKAVDEVFDSCFNDQAPFGRIPHNEATANMAHREFRNRGRYYANI